MFLSFERGRPIKSYPEDCHSDTQRKYDPHAIHSLAQNSTYKAASERVGCSINTVCIKIKEFHYHHDSDHELNQNLNAILMK